MSEERDLTERFSLGTILVKLKVVERGDVDETLAVQRTLSHDENLGELLVARGLIERGQLELALAAQRDLRSKDRTTRALAAARLAEMSSAKVVSFSRRLREEAAAARRDSNHVGFPAIRVPIATEGGE